MSMFSGMSDQGMEKQEDRVGGGGFILDTDLYTGRIKAAYVGKSSGGAMSITILFTPAGGKEYRETVYITKKTGENFYVKDGKKYPMPGFSLINNLCMIATGAPLDQQETEEKVLNIWNSDEKKELPTAVQVISGLTDAEVTFAIQKVLENKSELRGNDYVAIPDTRESNNIVNVIHTESGLTVREAEEGKTEPVYGPAWLEKNKGQVYDKRTIKDGAAGAPTRPGAAGGAPKSGDAQPRKSLFGNKG
ncbi:putative ssDNA-binding protein [Erwinia phage phiEaP8]|uniref:Single strand DNA binding protein n=2 Tax=Caudoviricetes TaxID=2731619 RepID=A0AB39ACN9_9CAUD|nr:single strand DNA binding protein [Erwinia phage phiEaP8]AWN06216.1 putative ssDNA-binding protein [Erwinia phage phiEaP8]